MANAIDIVIRATDQASAVLQRTAANTTRITSQLSAVGSALAAGAGAAAFVALGDAARQAADAVSGYLDRVEQIANSSQRAGVTTTQFQTIALALKEAGQSSDGLATAFRTLNNALAENDPKLRALGVQSNDAWGALRELADILASVEDPAVRVRIASETLGDRIGESLIPVLSQGARGLDELAAAGRATGAVIGDKAVANALALDTALDQLKRQFDGLSNSMLGVAVPAISAVLERLNSVVQLALRMPQVLEVVRLSFASLAPGKEGNKAFEDAIRLARELADSFKKTATAQTAAGAAAPGDAVSERIKQFLDALKPAKDRAKDVETLAQALRNVGAAPALADVSDLQPKFGKGVPELPQPVEPKFGEQVERFGKQVQDELLNATKATNDLIYALEFGLQSGFQTVFQNMLTGAQTFKSAMVSIFQSMVSAILSELARLAAAAIFKLLINIATGGTARAAAGIGEAIRAGVGFSATGASPGGRISGGGGGRALPQRSSLTREDLVSAFTEAMQRSGLRGGDTFNISALDTRSAYESIVSPQGGFRRANDRLGELAAAS